MSMAPAGQELNFQQKTHSCFDGGFALCLFSISFVLKNLLFFVFFAYAFCMLFSVDAHTRSHTHTQSHAPIAMLDWMIVKGYARIKQFCFSSCIREFALASKDIYFILFFVFWLLLFVRSLMSARIYVRHDCCRRHRRRCCC